MNTAYPPPIGNDVAPDPGFSRAWRRAFSTPR